CTNIEHGAGFSKAIAFTSDSRSNIDIQMTSISIFMLKVIVNKTDSSTISSIPNCSTYSCPSNVKGASFNGVAASCRKGQDVYCPCSRRGNLKYQTCHPSSAGWMKGPAGTGEHMYDGYLFGTELMTGAIAESWELPDEYTMVYHIRPGVRWQNKQPAWGREYTAQDTVRIFEWMESTPWSYAYVDPATPMEDRTRIELIDDMTVKVTFTYTTPARPQIWDFNWQAAPEVLEHVAAEGELPWENDWRYMCGTGPFILKDFVEDSAWEFVRNDLYWMHDPLHP
ncbi:unnamed protein product, partial [marine sediment metagenome]